MAPKPPMDVIIIGGSIAGLLCGIVLKRLGHTVHILEQSLHNVRQSQAAGIGLGPSIVDVLTRSGITCDDCAFFVDDIKILSRDVNIEAQKYPFSSHQTGWSVLYFKLRAAFDGFVTDVCPQSIPPVQEGSGKVHYDLGKKVTRVEDIGDHVQVSFDDLQTGEKRTMSAPLVVAADGNTSPIRSALCPDVARPYAGYMAWRTTLELSKLSPESRAVFDRGCCIFPATDDSYVIWYIIPSESGSISDPDRLLNLVWYDMLPPSSPLYTSALTSQSGHKHRHTLPPGAMQPSVWAHRIDRAKKVLPPPFVEVLSKIERPFVTAVSDAVAPQASFFDGKLLLVGEALAVARPHTGSAIRESAKQALWLEEVMEGRMGMDEWAEKALEETTANVKGSRAFGSRLLPIEADETVTWEDVKGRISGREADGKNS